MKALTLTQPWATLVAIGAKKIETRSWFTNYRGPLAIHAAKNFPDKAQYLCFKEPFRSTIAPFNLIQFGATYTGKHNFPLGCVIAICELVRVDRIYPGEDYTGGNEYEFGNYTPGRYAWILTNVKQLPEPIPARGAQGLWEWNGGL